MKLHELKIKRECFDAILDGKKTFELRKNDRDYQVGDLIHFVDINGCEFDSIHLFATILFPKRMIFEITYVLKDSQEYGLDKDYCIFGIKKLKIEGDQL